MFKCLWRKQPEKHLAKTAFKAIFARPNEQECLAGQESLKARSSKG